MSTEAAAVGIAGSGGGGGSRKRTRGTTRVVRADVSGAWDGDDGDSGVVLGVNK